MSKRFGLSVLVLLLAGFSASCGLVPGNGSESPSTPAQNAPASSSQKPADSQASNTAQASTGGALEVPAPIALPPSYNDRPPKPGETPQTLMPNGLPALQPLGVNVEELFAEKVRDSDKRFERLENAVLDLRREFETFKPAIVRLVAVEADIQDLIKQLDILLASEPSAPPQALSPGSSSYAQNAQPAPAGSLRDEPMLSAEDQVEPPDPEPAATPPPAPEVAAADPPPDATPPPVQPPAPASTGLPGVTALRIGEHSDKVRLVMDVSKKTPYTADLDNQERLLIVELADAAWNAPMQQTFGNARLIKSYTVEPINNGAGSRLILTLSKDTQILKEQALPPGEGNANHRIYMDLKL